MEYIYAPANRWLRALLLGAGLALIWLALMLFAAPSSASAAENEGGGLVGVVDDTVGSVTGAVDQVVTTVETIVPAAAPVTTALRPVVGTTTIAVTQTTSGVTAAVDQTASTALPAVSGVVHGAADLVGDGVPAIPVLGAVASALPVGAVLGHLAGTVDVVTGAAGSVIAGPVRLPGLPPLFPAESSGVAVAPPVAQGAGNVVVATATSLFRSLFGPDALGASTLVLLASGAGAIGAAGGLTRGLFGSPLGSASASIGSSTTGGVGGHAAAFLALPTLAWGMSLGGGRVNDALPGAPVFATDVTPD